MDGEIPKRSLGSTGRDISIIGMGGAHLVGPGSRRAAVRLIRAAIDRGITFLDNCWDYHGGRSEEWMGEALAGGYRSRVFLMTKIDGRTRRAAAAQIDQSLRRLRTDHVDLMQIHEVIHPDDPERIFAPGGAIEALEEARREGKIRHIGFTGHKDPRIHLRMLDQGFAWDAVQMPLNLLDARFNSFQKQVLPVLRQRGIGVLAMKPLAAGEFFTAGWTDGVAALRYVMSLPVDTVINGMESPADLDQALQAAVDFVPFGPAEMKRLEKRAAPLAIGGRFEGYKTTHGYDGTYWNPGWLAQAQI
ncbi:MAG: aldo/keto reductase [Actinobacteria bacterium]|nr:aldo/keto reductase [Actinomycetota bacterium]